MDGDLRIVIELLRELTGAMSRLETCMGGLEERMGGLDTRMGGLDTRMGGLEERVGGIEAQLDRHDRYFELIQQHLLGMDQRLGGVEQAVAGLDGRLGSLETRVGALEAQGALLERGLASLRVELRERFEGTDGRLRVLTEGFQFLEGRTAAQIAPIDPRLLALHQQIQTTQEQLGRMESANVHLGLRVETLVEDVRQRFRDLNERLAHVA